jgi:hypothetical protein
MPRLSLAFVVMVKRTDNPLCEVIRAGMRHFLSECRAPGRSTAEWC